MKVILSKKPKHVNILAGFPTFGVIGPIVGEYVIENLECELIGEIQIPQLEPMIVIQKGNVINPIEIYYSKKCNLVIIRSVNKLEGFESEITQALLEVMRELEAWELISLEGIADQSQRIETLVFGYTNNADSRKRLKEANVDPLSDGVIMGLTAKILAENKQNQKHTIFFATSHSQMPDSKAAAKIIGTLDSYLNMEIDPEPLLEQAQEYEEQLQQLRESTEHTQKERKLKKMSYVG